MPSFIIILFIKSGLGLRFSISFTYWLWGIAEDYVAILLMLNNEVQINEWNETKFTILLLRELMQQRLGWWVEWKRQRLLSSYEETPHPNLNHVQHVNIYQQTTSSTFYNLSTQTSQHSTISVHKHVKPFNNIKNHASYLLDDLISGLSHHSLIC